VSRFQKIVWCLFPLVVALATYWKMFDNYFLVDDWGWLCFAKQFKEGAITLFQQPSWGYFRPVVNAWFMVVYRLAGMHAVIYYFLNFGLHIINIYLVWYFAKTASQRYETAGLAAALFAVNVPSAEAVLWVSGISDVLGATWVLGTLFWCHKYWQKGGNLRLSAVTVFYGLALFTKETAALTLPGILISDLLMWHLNRGQRFRLYSLLVIITGVYLATGLFFWRSSVAVNDGLYALGWHALKNIPILLISLLTPNPFLFGTEKYLNGSNAGWIKLMFGGLFAGQLSGLLLSLKRGSAWLKIQITWTILFILPILFFLHPPRRTLYLASAAFSIVLVLAVRELLPGLREKILITGVLIIITADSLFIQVRENVYHNQTKLIKNAVSSVAAYCQNLPLNSVVIVRMENPPKYSHLDRAIEQGVLLLTQNDIVISFNQPAKTSDRGYYEIKLTPEGGLQQ